MPLEIRTEVARHLPSSVTNALGKMPAEQQAVFEEEFVRKRRNTVLMLILAIIFPIHFFFEGRVGMGLLYWLTFGGFGIWWLVEIFLVWGRTKGFNEDMAKSLLRDMRIMNG